MESNLPDYELEDQRALTEPEQVKALAHPMRTTILGLLHERAASVTELSTALDRPKSTVAHHVNVLVDAGLLKVVRTRRVRAIEESFYGRTARSFHVADTSPSGRRLPVDFNDFEVAARESQPAYAEGELWGFIRHARISPERKREFWRRMSALVQEFDALPREGDLVHGFAVGIYPIADYPQLPESRTSTAEPGP
ncbi:helix-turn-helix protein [Haloactinopolyspora alba]|uniref:Helix-turn-helix protein n=1 Tax=Haloactinopolyspora alba TaxID=648780 RepID=A0A2P8DX80_9ACTN|nr:metalloregulator ArsR/SmtB family transcription factor [Haloactinopolyspora alba]PSL01826.1 helix-turn-helix protein [Haloactinopolyspora alba]